ncbi:ABC transporter permease [Fibrella sp. HMF5335]|uniref:ABC transporter permease n=1 Tax=Fibrella rubiginis TaxID=2817060 RepID=A0A939GHV0_9BACT|nr:ABC transporter permease [Fibrella rubiginis]MBO0937484.1 ABC transporter permease [Fibrella rubiginis]
MLRNYITIALRNLRKNQAYALINITGLGLGVGCALLLFALVRYHFQTDRHHARFDRIYRITTLFNLPDGAFHTPGVPMVFGKTLRTDYPDIEQVAMLDEWEDPMVAVAAGGQVDRKFKDSHTKGAFVEPAYFNLFDYTWLSGGPADLNQPGTVVLEAKLAKRYFGTTNAVGKTLKLDARYPVRVVGVFADYRDNTDFGYTIMPSWASWEGMHGQKMLDDFNNINSSTLCFVLLNNRFTAANWAQQMLTFVKKHKNAEGAAVTRWSMQPLADVHFSTEHGGVSRGLLASLFAIGLLLIGTACINFVNLATAQALNRSREVGVRKVLGSTRGQLFSQFLGETTVIVLLATAAGLLIFSYGLQLTQTYLHGAFRFTFYFEPALIAWLGLILLGVVLLAGLYPALVLAGFKPVVALAGKITSRQAGGFAVRRGLVVAQFAISQVLVIGLVVVSSQLAYVRNKDLGFIRHAILTVRLPFVPQQDLTKMRTFKQLAQALPNVQKFSYSMSGAPQSGWESNTQIQYDTRAEEEKWQVQQARFDADYVDLYGLKLVAGRNMQPSDTAREALVNETFVRKIGAKSPADVLGKFIHQDSSRRNYEIVGVMKDYNQLSLKQEIKPLFITTRAANYYAANIQVQTGNFQQVISQLGALYNRVYPDSYFDSRFVDDEIEERYQEEQTMGKLVNFFAAVALLIGCMGLYGLVLFMVSQKTKEIGVRKVLGASMGSILWLFGREFSRLIAIAFVLAVPVAWWVMRGWLQTFEYKINLGPGVFALALLATVIVAALTVSFQSIRAALMNPVKSLRSE